MDLAAVQCRTVVRVVVSVSAGVAVRWDGTTPTSLGMPGGAYAANSDGSIIVGGNASAFIWTAAGAAMLLDVTLANLGADNCGWTLPHLIEISEDGTALVDYRTNPSGEQHGFIVQLKGIGVGGLERAALNKSGRRSRNTGASLWRTSPAVTTPAWGSGGATVSPLSGGLIQQTPAAESATFELTFSLAPGCLGARSQPPATQRSKASVWAVQLPSYVSIPALPQVKSPG
jgi:hypothetical protein